MAASRAAGTIWPISSEVSSRAPEAMATTPAARPSRPSIRLITVETQKIQATVPGRPQKYRSM